MYNVRHHHTLLILLSTTLVIQGCSPTTQTTDEVAISKKEVIQEEVKNTRGVLPTPYLWPALTTTMDSVSNAHPQKTARTHLAEKSQHFTPLASSPTHDPYYPQPTQFSQESYSFPAENSFISTANDSLSTFSIDVDTGSYTNIRRMLIAGHKVPVGAVRIEEMLNYFIYDYPEPKETPVGITTEVGPCPWNSEHKIARIGLKAKELGNTVLPPSNLVFLIDVSGSMNQPNKLPLVKNSLTLLSKELTSQDRIAIVVYAGSNRVVLPPTAGNETKVISQAIKQLSSAGSTHGSAGIVSAYKLAHQNFMPGGNNRIILASDGDFNVGVTSRGELTKLIEAEREKGVFLTVLGFGNGNYKDDTMEMLADRGNGNYSYIDSLLEAKKVLVKQRASTLFTLAKDVKLQVEFNPARVGAYHLIGYENRVLADEDFKNDKKDAGEIGLGHTVTALYELIPPGAPGQPSVPELKYSKTLAINDLRDELLTVKLRYKEPQGSDSKRITQTLIDSNREWKETSDDFRFATAVAWFGMHLRKSEYVTTPNYAQIIDIAQNSRGRDYDGLRAEFIKLVETKELLMN